MSILTHLSRNTSRSSGTAAFIDAKVKGEANSRFTADVNGKMQWGAGGASAPDTTMERSATAKLTVTGSFEITGTLTVAALSGVLKASGGAVSGSATTSDVPEGSNLYYTSGRFDTALSGKTTTNLAEGSNLYFTDSRVDSRITAAWRGAANGLASLDASSKIPTSQLPALAITDTFVVVSQAAMLALTAETGDVAVRTDENKTYILRGTDPSTLGDWQEMLTPGGTVTSVNGYTGSVTLTTSHISEGSNLYYSDTRVRACVLTGLNTGLTGAVTSSDTVLSALGRLENHRAKLTTRGDLLYRDVSGAARLAIGSANTVLRSDGTDAAWAKVNLTVDVTGTLPSGSGGTGTSTVGLGDVLYGAGSDLWARLIGQITTTRKFLRQTGDGAASAAPAWDTLQSGDIPSLAASKITSGVFGTAQGGTGAATTQANKVFAGPSSGADAAPTFRAMVSDDIPSLDAAKITTGTLALARGGLNNDLSGAATDSVLIKASTYISYVAPSDGIFVRSGGTPYWQTNTGWAAPTSYTTDRLSASGDDVAALRDVLCTLIADLRYSKVLST